ncbi:hypothetical protein [Peptostreptococcus faecalis]|uniref:hypothetical protein n=1 Tax=Peptostreptococcus faecalis TaxID=2045015 RepID=UPI000C7A2608|nr:hypothetical protein [Peptostreptococcus faecalis]
MDIKKQLEFKKYIYDLLKEDETLVEFSVAGNQKSIYVGITNNQSEYICFRISDHKTTQYYSNRTFYSEKSKKHIKNEIRDYINKTQWYKCIYEDMYTLNCIKYMEYRNLNLFLDVNNPLFIGTNNGLLFYQEVKYSDGIVEKNNVSKSMEKSLRKLYSTGIISEHNADNSIYITAVGYAIYDYFFKNFMNDLITDFDLINWRFLEIEKR